jgi:uroporphyrinogen decarboxylase
MSPIQQLESHAGLSGMTVVSFESRMATETATLIERFGGRAIVARSMREVPIEENPAALDFAKRLLEGRLDVAIFLTGVGVRALFEVIDARHDKQRVVDALGRCLSVARGPKPVKALRQLGIEPSILVPEPNTWRELVSELSRRTTLADKDVAVQEYGISNRDLMAALEARGARVVAVPVYRWAMPLDRAPLIAALKTIAKGEAEVAIFTSQNQVINVMQIAEAAGLADDVRRAMRAMVVASVGPVCSEALRSHGLPVDIEPQHPKLGNLIREAADRAREVAQSKRRGTIAITEQPSVRAPSHPTDGLRMGSLYDSSFLKACRRERVPYTPIWLMRQAGRYLPEYRKMRAAHSFLEMCQEPELAADVTVTAVERLKVDAAIVFADILLPLVPMQVGLSYEKGDGPTIERPLLSANAIEKIPQFSVEAELGFVGEAIKIARAALGGKTPLIGFAGAPFTLASYLIEGGGSRQYLATKATMYRNSAMWHRLMGMLARVTVDYLKMQIAAGADAVQLFDSWVGSLGPEDYRRFVLPYTKQVIEGIGASVPVIHFGTITGNLIELMKQAGGDVIGLDWRVSLSQAWERLGYDVAVQGNLDPVALFAEVGEIRARAKAILDEAAGRPGHIFNLGHGILPDTPVDHVKALVDSVHELSLR